MGFKDKFTALFASNRRGEENEPAGEEVVNNLGEHRGYRPNGASGTLKQVNPQDADKSAKTQAQPQQAPAQGQQPGPGFGENIPANAQPMNSAQNVPNGGFTQAMPYHGQRPQQGETPVQPQQTGYQYAFQQNQDPARQPYRRPMTRAQQYTWQQTGQQAAQPVQFTGQQAAQPVQFTGQQAAQPVQFTGHQAAQPVQFTGQQAAQPMQFTGQQAAQPVQYTGQQAAQPMQFTGQQAAQPVQFTGQQAAQPVQYTGQQAAQPMQYTGQQAASYTSHQPLPFGRVRPTAQVRDTQTESGPSWGNGRGDKDYHYSTNQRGRTERPKRNSRAPQRQPQPKQEEVPANITYMNPEHFVDNGTAYAMVLRLAQPVNTASCYRLIQFMRNGESVLVNMELIRDDAEVGRCLDLLYGAAFAMGCAFTRVAVQCLYLITPRSVEVLSYASMEGLSQRDAAHRWPGTTASAWPQENAQPSQDSMSYTAAPAQAFQANRYY